MDLKSDYEALITKLEAAKAPIDEKIKALQAEKSLFTTEIAKLNASIIKLANKGTPQPKKTRAKRKQTAE